MEPFAYRRTDVILVDCDGVVVDFDPVAAAPGTERMRERGLDMAGLVGRLDDWNGSKQYWITGKIPFAAAVRAAMGEGEPVPVPEVVDFLFTNGFVRNTSAIETISRWKAQRNIPAILLTNNCNERVEFLLSPAGGNLAPYFDGVVNSGTLGLHKDQPEFYVAADDAIARIFHDWLSRPAPETHTLLDDSDYALNRAKAAGWDTVKVTSPSVHSIFRFIRQYDEDHPRSIAAEIGTKRDKTGPSLNI